MRSGHGQVPRRLLRSLDAPLVDGSAIGRLPGELYNRAQIDGDGAGDGEVLADGNVAGEGAVDDGRRHEGRLRVDMQHNVVGRDAAVARLRLAREHARVLLHRHRRYSEANLQTSLIIIIINDFKIEVDNPFRLWWHYHIFLKTDIAYRYSMGCPVPTVPTDAMPVFWHVAWTRHGEMEIKRCCDDPYSMHNSDMGPFIKDVRTEEAGG